MDPKVDIIQTGYYKGGSGSEIPPLVKGPSRSMNGDTAPTFGFASFGSGQGSDTVAFFRRNLFF